jgi:hypothetical protein
LVRVPRWRDTISDLSQLLRAKITSLGGNPDESGFGELSPDELKAWGLLWFKEVPDLVAHFHDKDWMLLRATAKYPLYVSDNPIVLHNQKDHRPFGNLGLAVRGIEIYLPLSSTLCLAMLCPSHRLDALEAIRSACGAPGEPQPIAQARLRLQQFADALHNADTVDLVPANVDHLNSLQVRTSSRYVYSAAANFDLAREILSSWPDLRHGAKPVLQ